MIYLDYSRTTKALLQKGRKNSYEELNHPKKGRHLEVLDANGNLTVTGQKSLLVAREIDNRAAATPKLNTKCAHYFKKWLAPEWVPCDIPTLPKHKVKERD